MKNELENQIEGDIRNHQKVFDEWRKEYNRERPHEALLMETPEKIYSKSEQKYEDYEELDYPNPIRRRKVNNRGFITYETSRYFVGNPFTGYFVGVEPKRGGGQDIWFGNQRLGSMDMKTKLLIPADELIIKTRNSRRVLPMS